MDVDGDFRSIYLSISLIETENGNQSKQTLGKAVKHKNGKVTAEGVLSYEDILGHIAAKRSAGVMELPEIVDVRCVTPKLSVNDLKRIASEVAKALKGKPPGRTAVVSNSASVHGSAHSYSIFAGSADSEFEVFSDLDQARTWLFERSATPDG